tara:strand:- start:33030 stop:33221 length:192 start_codon:yes stop_codon:yes gene_type:complete
MTLNIEFKEINGRLSCRKLQLLESLKNEKNIWTVSGVLFSLPASRLSEPGDVTAQSEQRMGCE